MELYFSYNWISFKNCVKLKTVTGQWKLEVVIYLIYQSDKCTQLSVKAYPVIWVYYLLNVSLDSTMCLTRTCMCQVPFNCSSMTFITSKQIFPHNENVTSDTASIPHRPPMTVSTMLPREIHHAYPTSQCWIQLHDSNKGINSCSSHSLQVQCAWCTPLHCVIK